MAGMTGDTIYALSSGAGRAGVAVVRVSGPRASQCVERLCGRLPQARMAELSKLADGEAIDTGLVLWFPAPASFTGEDVAEFHVHGSRAVLARLMQALSTVTECRPAEAGEISTRALANGKKDLMAVEGLSDLIAAETEEQRRQALFHQTGGAAARLDGLRETLIRTLAHLEAAIDFVDEEGVEGEALALARPGLKEVRHQLVAILGDAHRGERLRDGVKVVIAGAPNVGKSSLLNALARREAAIVSPIEGTTRDAIEVAVDLAGVPVVIADTAGLRARSGDEIENIGMKRTRDLLAEADVVVWMSAPDVDRFGTDSFDSQALRILNKADLLTGDKVPKGYDAVISTRDAQSIDSLVDLLCDRVEAAYVGSEPAVVSRHRHRIALEACQAHIARALEAEGARLELVTESVRLAVRELGRVTGRVDVEDLLDVIFSEFCIGK